MLNHGPVTRTKSWPHAASDRVTIWDQIFLTNELPEGRHTRGVSDLGEPSRPSRGAKRARPQNALMSSVSLTGVGSSPWMLLLSKCRQQLPGTFKAR